MISVNVATIATPSALKSNTAGTINIRLQIPPIPTILTSKCFSPKVIRIFIANIPFAIAKKGIKLLILSIVIVSLYCGIPNKILTISGAKINNKIPQAR